MTKDIFSDLVLPSDDEINDETHKLKLSLAKKGKPGNKCSEEQKKQISIKNSVSRMSEYQRQKLIISNKKNPRHTIPHTPASKQKISESIMNKPNIICPHCGSQSKTGIIYRWHFDNCKLK
jgi:hypothetical protein